MKLSILSVPVAAAATFLLLTPNKVVLGEGDVVAQCVSDIDAMVESSPELSKAMVAYGNEVSDMIISLLEAVDDFVGIDPMIHDNFILACQDAGGIAVPFKDTVFSCVVDSSGEEFTVTPSGIGYCNAPTEACDDEDVWFSLANLGIDHVPGYECARLEMDSDGGVEDDAQCESDIFAMVENSPELAQATVDYENEMNGAVNAALVALADGKDDGFVGIDPMIRENYELACNDAGGVPYFRDDTPYDCVDSSGSTLTLAFSFTYCKPLTEACENVPYFWSIHNIPGFECVQLDNDVVEVQASGSNVLNWTNNSLMMVAGSLFVTLFTFIS